MSTFPQRGDIWLADLNGTEIGKCRPVIVLQCVRDAMNFEMIFIVPLSSRIDLSDRPRTVRINATPRNRLQRSSVAMACHSHSIRSTKLMHLIGTVEDATFQEVRREVAAILAA